MQHGETVSPDRKAIYELSLIHIYDAYCRDISIKIRSHLDVKRKNGEYIGAFVPYGYEKRCV